jgi:arylsulfatase A-like enzyme
MIVIILWDGLRPDAINADTTPFLYGKAAEGVTCSAGHAAFPTATRVNSACLATGCHPMRHGIVANDLYAPRVNPDEPATCGDWRFLRALADSEGGRVVHAPTLGERLSAAGKRYAFCGSGSTGTAFLGDPALSGPIINWETAWPASVRDELTERVGAFPRPESPKMDRSRFVLAAVEKYVLPEHRPDVLTVWLSEPDGTQHAQGLGSKAVRLVLRELDGMLEELLGHLEKSDGRDEITAFFFSDHGFGTVSERVDPSQRLFEAGLKESLTSIDVVYSAANVYVSDSISKQKLAEIVAFLECESWVGGVFLREDLLDAVPGAMAQSALLSGTHPRSAAITISFNWSNEANEHGVRGTIASDSGNRATHGPAAPFTVNNSFLAWGAGIKRRVVSDVPCGVVDVAPTVLHLMGIDGARTMDGRVLFELLEEGPHPAQISVTRESKRAERAMRNSGLRQEVCYRMAEGRRYLDCVRLVED